MNISVIELSPPLNMKFVGILSWALIQRLMMCTGSKGEHVLIFHHLASYSHIVATWPLAEGLSSRGHQVSYISPYRSKTPNPNITEFVPENMEKFVDDYINAEFDVNHRVQGKMPKMSDNLLDFGYRACEALYSSPDFPEWLTKHVSNIDLVLVDNCVPECGVGLAYKLGAKFTIFNTIAPIAYEYDAYGMVPESSSVPEVNYTPPLVPMGFLVRVSNAIASLQWRLHHVIYSLKIDNYIRKMLQVPDMPFIGDLMTKVSLIFSTSDVVTDYPRAMPPIVVNVAGIHCKESTNALPLEVESFIRGVNGTANDGFVYISLGSVVVSSNLPESIKSVFFETIKSFPNLRFLWKWNGEFPTDIPPNLYLGKWFPQIDVLGHENIRAFVTQTGRPSAMEALFNGVPMIAFPVLGDQDYNAQRMAETGAAVSLEIATVTKEIFQNAIQKSVYDPSTKARLTKLQTAFRDRPMSPVDTAVWWTEYLLRTEDTEHLRATGINQNWFVRRQIDVWAFLSITLFATVISTLTLLLKIVRPFFKTHPKLKNA